MQKVLLLLTIFILGCNSESPTIQSTNLTGLEIPDYVDQKVWEFMPEKEEMTSISIVYKSKFRTPEGVEDVGVCYEVVEGGNRYYGLVARVEGEWFAMIPGNEKFNCPTDNSAMRERPLCLGLFNCNVYFATNDLVLPLKCFTLFL